MATLDNVLKSNVKIYHIPLQKYNESLKNSEIISFLTDLLLLAGSGCISNSVSH